MMIVMVMMIKKNLDHKSMYDHGLLLALGYVFYLFFWGGVRKKIYSRRNNIFLRSPIIVAVSRAALEHTLLPILKPEGS